MLAAAPSKPQSASLKKSFRATFSLTNRNLTPQKSTTQHANRINTKGEAWESHWFMVLIIKITTSIPVSK